MADQELVNPIGEEGENWSTGVVVQYAQYDPTVAATTTLINGQIVACTAGFLPGTGLQATGVTATAYPVVKASPITTAINPNLGVVVNAPTGGYVPGNIIAVAIGGIVQILCDSGSGGTTNGNFIVAGTTVLGAGTAAATSTEGRTIAVCLQTVVIASGTALVYGQLRLI